MPTTNSSTEPTTVHNISDDTDRHLRLMHTQSESPFATRTLTYVYTTNGPSGFKAGRQKGIKRWNS